MNAVTLRLVLVRKQGEEPENMALGDVLEAPLDKYPVYIGRCEDVELYVGASSVGRHVVRIWLGPDGVRIEDTCSGGGSALEFNRVFIERPSSQPLLDQSLLWIGLVVFRVELIRTG